MTDEIGIKIGKSPKASKAPSSLRKALTKSLNSISNKFKNKDRREESKNEIHTRGLDKLGLDLASKERMKNLRSPIGESSDTLQGVYY